MQTITELFHHICLHYGILRRVALVAISHTISHTACFCRSTSNDRPLLAVLLFFSSFVEVAGEGLLRTGTVSGRVRRRRGHPDAVGRLRTHEARPVRTSRVRFDRLPGGRPGARRRALLRAPVVPVPDVDPPQHQTLSERARRLPRSTLRMCQR